VRFFERLGHEAKANRRKDDQDEIRMWKKSVMTCFGTL
jgi:hypothetical protein